MRLGMAQMSMSKDMDENFAKTLDFCDKAAGCNLLFFPEVQNEGQTERGNPF